MDRNEKAEKAISYRAEMEGPWAVAYALLQLAKAQDNVAYQLKYLGNGNASTAMGAIEGLSVKIYEGLELLAASNSDIAAQIGNHVKD